LAIWELEGLDCHKCGEAEKLLRGCEADVQSFDVRGEQYTRCPKKLVTDKTYAWLEYYRFFDKGLLPSGDAILNQAHKFIKVMELIGIEVSKYNQARIKNGGKT
jgi:hypothetical protein